VGNSKVKTPAVFARVQLNILIAAAPYSNRSDSIGSNRDAFCAG
jgi:hypothetical protein